MPIPGESVTLNHSELLSQAKEEQQNLKDKLKEMLKEVEYPGLQKRSRACRRCIKRFKGEPLGHIRRITKIWLMNGKDQMRRLRLYS